LSARQHYECNYCNQVWAHLSTLVALSTTGRRTYPVADAFAEYIGNDIDPVMVALFANNPDVLHAIQNTATRNAQVTPIAQLSTSLVAKTVGGFEHYFGALDKSVVDEWNANHTEANDFQHVKTLFTVIMSPDLNLPLLTKIFAYIEKELGKKEHTALSRAEELLTIINDVRHIHQYTNNGLVYLWALLHVRTNGWLNHVSGSILGIVIDAAVEMKGTDDMVGALARVKQMLITATAGENYKQKTAAATEASIDQAFKFLEEKGLKDAMVRRLMPIEEVKSVIWSESAVAVAETAETPNLSTVDAAFQRLKDAKNPDVAANKKMDELLGNTVVAKRISLAELIRTLDEYSQISVCNATMSLMPLFATTSVTSIGGDSAELFNFNQAVGKDVMLLSLPTVQPYYQLAKWAGLMDVEATKNGTLNRVIYPDMPVKAVFSSKHFSSDEADYILFVEGFALNFYNDLRQFGSCILGSAIKSEHLGMSRALCELSKQIVMNTDAGKNAAGGVFLSPGIVLNAVCKDGSKAQIMLTSMK
jgi:hypothetical protein